VILVLMMALAVAALAVMLAGALVSMDGRSAIALLVVVISAAAAGIAFSWKRYFPRRG
jgi:hypothetical protein